MLGSSFSPLAVSAYSTVGGTVAKTWRVGHSRVKKGALPVAPSAIAIPGQQHFTMEGLKDYETPHALTVDEIQQIIQDYQ